MNSIAGNIPSPAPLGALQPSSDVSTRGAPKYTITYGTYGGIVPTINGSPSPLSPVTSLNIITFSPSDIRVYMQCDFTYDISTGIISIIDSLLIPTSSNVPANIMTMGAGTIYNGTLYQEIFGVNIINPIGSGTYTVIASPSVGGSQNFGVCVLVSGPSISGPWGV